MRSKKRIHFHGCAQSQRKPIHVLKIAACSEIRRTAKIFYILTKRKTCIYAVLNKFNYQNRQMKTTTCLPRLLLIGIVSLLLPSLYPANHKGEKYACLHTLKGHTDEVNNVTFSPDGKTLASADDKSIKVWDTNTWECLRTLKGHTGQVWSVAFAPDSKTLASANLDKTIRTWDSAKGTCLGTMTGHTDEVNSVTFSPDGKTLASTSYKEVKIWDTSTWECLHTLRGHTADINKVVFAPDGKTFASVSGEWNKAGEIKMWDAAHGTCLRTMTGHKYGVNAVAFAPNGKTFASASSDCAVKVWDIATGTCLRTLKGHLKAAQDISYASDNKMCLVLISGYCRQYAYVPNVITSLISRYTLHMSRTLASAGYDKFVKVWDVSTGTCLCTLKEHTKPVLSVCYAPSGQILASASSDKTIKIWGIKH